MSSQGLLAESSHSRGGRATVPKWEREEGRGQSPLLQKPTPVITNPFCDDGINLVMRAESSWSNHCKESHLSILLVWGLSSPHINFGWCVQTIVCSFFASFLFPVGFFADLPGHSPLVFTYLSLEHFHPSPLDGKMASPFWLPWPGVVSLLWASPPWGQRAVALPCLFQPLAAQLRGLGGRLGPEELVNEPGIHL
jgi:hypothetical protein